MSERPPRTVWLNGRFLAEPRATLPATHELVTHGVGVFETLRVVRGSAPWIGLHQERLHLGAARIGLDPRQRDWGRIVAELAGRNRIRSGRARITLGRDVALVTCEPLPRGVSRERREGVALRSTRLRRPLPDLKATSWLPLLLAERAAGGEVLLVGDRGAALETSRSNFFAVSARGIETASAPDVLPGIARQVVLELCRELELPLRLRSPRIPERAEWREAFLTNAVRGVRPVQALDGQPLPRVPADGIARRLQRALDGRLGIPHEGSRPG